MLRGSLLVRSEMKNLRRRMGSWLRMNQSQLNRNRCRNSDQADGLEGKDMVVEVEVTAAPNILEAKDIIGEPAEMG